MSEFCMLPVQFWKIRFEPGIGFVGRVDPIGPYIGTYFLKALLTDVESVLGSRIYNSQSNLDFNSFTF